MIADDVIKWGCNHQTNSNLVISGICFFWCGSPEIFHPPKKKIKNVSFSLMSRNSEYKICSSQKWMKMCNLFREKRKVFIWRISFSQSVLSGRETLEVCKNTEERTDPARFAVKPQISHPRFVNCAIASKILSLCISEIFLLSVPHSTEVSRKLVHDHAESH